MPEARFCENCGGSLHPEDRFCQSCGAAVKTTAQEPVPATPPAQASQPVAPAPVAPAPQAPQPTFTPPATPGIPPTYTEPVTPVSAPKGLNPAGLGIGLAAIIAIAFGAWWFGFRKPATKVDDPKQNQTSGANAPGQAPSDPNGTASTDLSGTSSGTGAATNAPTGSVQTPKTNAGSTASTGTKTANKGLLGQAFIGSWFAKDGPDEFTVKIVRKNGKLVGTVQGEQGWFELTPGNGPVLNGYAYGDDEKIPMTAEITASKKKLILTALPPASEPDEITLTRVTNAPPDVQGGSSNLENIPGIETIKDYTEQHARWLVEDLPEVKAFIQRAQKAGSSVHIDVEPEDSRTWAVRVYEIVDDGGSGHTATFGWYKVDRKTGKVTEGM